MTFGDEAEENPDGAGRDDIEHQHGEKAVPRLLAGEIGGDRGAAVDGDGGADDDGRQRGHLPGHALPNAEQRGADQHDQHRDIVRLDHDGRSIARNGVVGQRGIGD